MIGANKTNLYIYDLKVFFITNFEAKASINSQKKQ